MAPMWQINESKQITTPGRPLSSENLLPLKWYPTSSQRTLNIASYAQVPDLDIIYYIMMCILCMYVKKYISLSLSYCNGSVRLWVPSKDTLPSNILKLLQTIYSYNSFKHKSTSELNENHKTKNIPQIHKAKKFMWGIVNIYLKNYCKAGMLWVN